MTMTSRIGSAAREAGVSVDTVRFYERQGLLPDAPRTAAGYRLYSPATVARLRFIDRAKLVGFSLAEVRELLALGDHPERDMASLRARVGGKLRAVKEKLAELERICRALERLYRQCPGRGALDQCPILAALQNDEASPARPLRHSPRVAARLELRKRGRGSRRASESNSRSRT